MEYEVRFYYPTEKLEHILAKLEKIDIIEKKNRSYEKTIQFDHPCSDMSFYTKEIDGRFRIRITKNEDSAKCKISWKRRLKSTTKNKVNEEEEVEINIDYSEYNNLMFLIENVIKMKRIESYERYRIIFVNEEIEIAVDEYPFGIALEIESKSNNNEPMKIVEKWVNELGMDIHKAYRLSWDDKYRELCKIQNIKQYSDVTFDKIMPKIIE